MSGPDVEGVVRSSLEGRCGNCLLPIATASDWDTYGEGEGEHLCWEPESCMAAEGDLAAHVAAALRAEVRAWLESEGAANAAQVGVHAIESCEPDPSVEQYAASVLAALAEQVGQVASVGEGEG